MKSEWIKVLSQIIDTAEDTKQVQCPICKQNEMDYMYIGDKETRIGYLQIWCNRCKKGIYVSRVKAPMKAKFLPFGSELKGIIPMYDCVDL